MLWCLTKHPYTIASPDCNVLQKIHMVLLMILWRTYVLAKLSLDKSTLQHAEHHRLLLIEDVDTGRRQPIDVLDARVGQAACRQYNAIFILAGLWHTKHC